MISIHLLETGPCTPTKPVQKGRRRHRRSSWILFLQCEDRASRLGDIARIVAADKLRIMLAGSLADEPVAAFAPNLPDHDAIAPRAVESRARNLRGSAIRQPCPPRQGEPYHSCRYAPCRTRSGKLRRIVRIADEAASNGVR